MKLTREGPATFQELMTFVQRAAVAMESEPKFWKVSTPKKKTKDNHSHSDKKFWPRVSVMEKK